MEDWRRTDRRKFPRVIFPCMVTVVSPEHPQEPFLSHTENIGMGGICIVLKKEIKLFTPVEMMVDLLDLEDNIRPKGKVVWNVRRKTTDTIKPSYFDTGIEFTDMSNSDHDRLFENLMRLIDKGVKLTKPFV